MRTSIIKHPLLPNLQSFDKRIKGKNSFDSWDSDCGFVDSIREECTLNFDGLSDHEKMCLYIYSWTKEGYIVSKKSLVDKFGWTKYKIQKLYRELGGIIEIDTIWSERTGLIAGKGYSFWVGQKK